MSHIILLHELPCVVLKADFEACHNLKVPDVRFRDYSIVDGRLGEDFFLYHMNNKVPTFSEDANVFECVLVTLIRPLPFAVVAERNSLQMKFLGRRE